MKTAAEFEQDVIQLLKANRPGESYRGCHNHLEVYAHKLQHEILSPLLKEAYEAGRTGPIDDLGHDTAFAAAWNRAIEGKSEDWDCRSLASILIQDACRELGHQQLFKELFAGEMDNIDDAIIRNLPEILAGGSMKPGTRDCLRSWVDGDYIYVTLDGYQPILQREDGSPLTAPEPLPGSMDVEMNQDGFELVGLMSFHGPNTEYDESQKAWQAWRDAMDKAELLKHGYYDSMVAMMVRSVKSLSDVGICMLTLRQDEHLSVDISDEGCMIYRGQVDEMDTIVDEGQFLFGGRKRFEQVLVDGGFTAEEASDFIERQATGTDGFIAKIPAGSEMRFAIDPETLYAYDDPDDEGFYDISKEEALPVLAAGTFEMPEMTSWRARKAETAAQDPEITL
jgi:hypothetical protein